MNVNGKYPLLYHSLHKSMFTVKGDIPTRSPRTREIHVYSKCKALLVKPVSLSSSFNLLGKSMQAMKFESIGT